MLKGGDEMSYWGDYLIDQQSPFDYEYEHVSCSCGCAFTATICKAPGNNDHETYNCPDCNKEYSTHCFSVLVKKD